MDSLLLRGVLAGFRAMARYSRFEVQGIEHLLEGPSGMLIGYHGRPFTLDYYYLCAHMHARYGWLSRVVSELSPVARVRDGVRALFLVFHDSGERQASSADVTFTPDLSAFDATDFLKAGEIIAQAERELPPVLALTAERYRAFLDASRGRS